MTGPGPADNRPPGKPEQPPPPGKALMIEILRQLDAEVVPWHLRGKASRLLLRLL